MYNVQQGISRDSSLKYDKLKKKIPLKIAYTLDNSNYSPFSPATDFRELSRSHVADTVYNVMQYILHYRIRQLTRILYGKTHAVAQCPPMMTGDDYDAGVFQLFFPGCMLACACMSFKKARSLKATLYIY